MNDPGAHARDGRSVSTPLTRLVPATPSPFPTASRGVYMANNNEGDSVVSGMSNMSMSSSSGSTGNSGFSSDSGSEYSLSRSNSGVSINISDPNGRKTPYK